MILKRLVWPACYSIPVYVWYCIKQAQAASRPAEEHH